jgi:DNA anti-recombination protein RmuC
LEYFNKKSETQGVQLSKIDSKLDKELAINKQLIEEKFKQSFDQLKTNLTSLTGYKEATEKELKELINNFANLDNILEEKYKVIAKSNDDNKQSLHELISIFKNNKQRGSYGELVLGNILTNSFGLNCP